ncbi:MAG: Ligand-binding SRPBCC domain protein family, partial [uncultured Rubrobacteraceae bacterium]
DAPERRADPHHAGVQSAPASGVEGVDRARACQALVGRGARRGDERGDRPSGGGRLAVRDGDGRRVRGRLPRRVPRGRPQRADRLDGGLRGHAGGRGAEHRDVQRRVWAHDRHGPRAAREQGGPRRAHGIRDGDRHAGGDGSAREGRDLASL